jgi:hypothetical protein
MTAAGQDGKLLLAQEAIPDRMEVQPRYKWSASNQRVAEANSSAARQEEVSGHGHHPLVRATPLVASRTAPPLSQAHVPGDLVDLDPTTLHAPNPGFTMPIC